MKLEGSGIPEDIERIGAQVVDAGYKVHEVLHAGLLESAYEHCLAYELSERGLQVQRQLAMPIKYKGTELDTGYRIDLLVASAVIVEVKAVETLLPIHQAQLLTYLRLSGCRLGFLMNFNVTTYRAGLRRVVL